MMPKSAAWLAVRYTSAVCSSAFAGMQPRFRQVPPTLSRSTMAMLSPAEAPYGSGAEGSRYQGQRGPTPSKSFQNFHRTVI